MRDTQDPKRPASTMRRRLIAAAALLPTLAFAARAGAQQTSGDQPAQDGNADFLFVQTAKSVAYDAHQNRLTLRGVSPVTLFFTDRPERIAGNMKTQHFADALWSQGKDSFLSDPPNADLSVLDDKGNLVQAVVELHDPVIEGEDLHYTVEIIGGDMPELGDNASLFIDIIGMPLTPLSFAGARRRVWRRAVWR